MHPPRPSEVNPNVPADLEKVMARLLAKNRDARLPNAEVALQQLQSLLDSGVFGAEPLAPVGATAPPPPSPIAPPPVTTTTTTTPDVPPPY